MPDNQPKSVLITGCSSGIGRALALEFRRTGCRTFATARSAEAVAALDREGYDAIQLDVTDRASVQAAVDRVVEESGSIDVLVNNAGRTLIGPTAEVPLDEFRDVLETNVVGALATCQAAFPHMAAQRSGTIINIGSVIGLVAIPYSGAYCASKAALHLLSDALRLEAAPFGIDVVVVQPGAVKSSFGDNASRGVERYESDDSLYKVAAGEIRKRATLSQQNPMDNRDFARKLVGILNRPGRPPAVIRLGKGAKALPVASGLPTRVRDRLLSNRFGLDKLN